MVRSGFMSYSVCFASTCRTEVSVLADILDRHPCSQVLAKWAGLLTVLIEWMFECTECLQLVVYFFQPLSRRTLSSYADFRQWFPVPLTTKDRLPTPVQLVTTRSRRSPFLIRQALIWLFGIQPHWNDLANNASPVGASRLVHC